MSERRVEAQVIGPASPGFLRVHIGEREHDVPADRLPPALRMPNAHFVAIMG